MHSFLSHHRWLVQRATCSQSCLVGLAISATGIRVLMRDNREVLSVALIPQVPESSKIGQATVLKPLVGRLPHHDSDIR